MNIRKRFKVNLELLPFKVHYFFVYAAFGGVLPYLPVVAKQLGISASALGITYSILPFCSFLTKPLVGLLTDYFRQIKVFVLSLTILSVLCLLCILFLPPINSDTKNNMQFQVMLDNSRVMMPFAYEKSCLELKQFEEIKCTFKTFDITNRDDALCILRISKNQTLENLDIWLSNKSLLVSQTSNRYAVTGNCSAIPPNSPMDCHPDLRDCLLSDSSDSISVYNSYQYYGFTLLVVMSSVAAFSVMSLSDVACYELLGDQDEHYGRQRLWGTISWGVICSLSGILSDVASKNSVKRDFSPGFYLMLIFTGIDFITLVKVRMVKTKFSSNMCKDIKTILSSSEIIVFAIGVYIIGVLTSLTDTYELWYLEDLGATQTLLGSTVAMQCLVGEVPFLFFSGWFVKKFGHFLCLAAAFAGFALRLGLYSAIKNPWLALPIDISHGLTFAIFYATMTSFSSQRGPLGMEATMLGVLAGLYDGLGPCTGSFLGGIGLDKLGGRHTFLVASIISLLCVPIFCVAPKFIDMTRKVNKASFQTEIPVDHI